MDAFNDSLSFIIVILGTRLLWTQVLPEGGPL